MYHRRGFDLQCRQASAYHCNRREDEFESAVAARLILPFPAVATLTNAKSSAAIFNWPAELARTLGAIALDS